ncbi:MAG: transposase [Planctomycetota bacterium]
MLRGAFAAGSERFGFRLVQYSVQNDYLHLIVEGKDRRALSRGMQGLLIRVAKALNRLWGRRGTVFSDRYHDRILRTPREVRNVLRYVLQNTLRHWVQRYGAPRRKGIKPWLDPFASGCWFDGWKERLRLRGLEGVACPVAVARTWLLTEGWRRHGLISLEEQPGVN